MHLYSVPALAAGTAQASAASIPNGSSVPLMRGSVPDPGVIAKSLSKKGILESVQWVRDPDIHSASRPRVPPTGVFLTFNAESARNRTAPRKLCGFRPPTRLE